MGRRERLIKSGWRHGIVGVDDADSPETQVFYQSARNDKQNLQQNKDVINNRRQKRKYNYSCVTNDLIVSRNGSWYGHK